MSTFMQFARQHIMPHQSQPTSPSAAASTHAFDAAVFMYARGLLLCFYPWVCIRFFSLTSLFTPRSIAAARLNARESTCASTYIFIFSLCTQLTQSEQQAVYRSAWLASRQPLNISKHQANNTLFHSFCGSACKNIPPQVCVCARARTPLL